MFILWWLFYSSLPDFCLIMPPNIIKKVGSKQKGVPAKVNELEQLKHSSTKLQDVTSLQSLKKKNTKP